MFDVKKEYEKFVDTFKKAHNWTGASDNRLVAEEFLDKKKRFYKVFSIVFNDLAHGSKYSMIDFGQNMHCLINLSDLKTILMREYEIEMLTNRELYKKIDNSDITLGQILALN